MEENWKDIKDYEGIYLISSNGIVKRPAYKRWSARNNCFCNHKEYILKHCFRRGYPSIELNRDGKGRMEFMHRIIAKAFIPNPENKKEVNHINGIKHDNRVENLEWCTRTENSNHSVNTLRKNVGDSHGNRKLNSSEAMQIRMIYNKKRELKMTVFQIGYLFGVTGTNVCYIGKGMAWKQ